jgi:rod shape-determining protein MreC
MKPLHLAALLAFLAGAIWALTRSDRAVRDFRNTYYRALSPFVSAGSSLESTARSYLKESETIASMEQELGRLRPEAQRASLLEKTLRSLEEENDTLRKALSFQQQSPFRIGAARVLQRNPSTWWQGLEITSSHHKSLQPGAAVLSANGLAGRLERTSPDSSHSSVLLLTDASCMVAAKVAGAGEQGIVAGRGSPASGDSRLRLRFLSPDSRVQAGQQVLTSGLGGQVPANILIGEIESVRKGSLESEALVRPATDFTKLDTLFVILPETP